eukprot:gene21743-41875_t
MVPRKWPRQWLKVGACTAALVMKPSTTITRRSAAACSTAPTRVATSKPPSAANAAYEFHRVYQLCNQFCAVTLSAVYHDILKDRLYTL